MIHLNAGNTSRHNHKILKGMFKKSLFLKKSYFLLKAEGTVH